MKRVVIDTNVLISFVTDRNLEQQGQAARIFESAKRSQIMVLCHQNVVTEFVYVLDRIYHVEPITVQGMLRNLIDMPGVELVNELDFSRLLAVWPDRCPDYGDAVLLAFCIEYKNVRLATFDRKFAKVSHDVGINLYDEVL
jgi:predicted nucleic acid-binding protein